METTSRKTWLNVGTVLAAFGASLCCILPVAVAFLGVGSAALGAQLEPYRPYFLGLTVVFLGFAFFQAYKPVKSDCAPGEVCAVPASRRRQRLLLWSIAIAALALMTFPYYIGSIL